MKKKTYQRPVVQVMKIEPVQIIASTTSTVTELDGNAGIDFGGGGSGPARSRRQSGDWDDD